MSATTVIFVAVLESYKEIDRKTRSSYKILSETVHEDILESPEQGKLAFSFFDTQS